MKKSLLTGLAVSLLLTACASNPPSYLPNGTKPIINVEANVDPLINIDACGESLSIANKTEQVLSLAYKLFWYDKQGVSQGQTSDMGEKTLWQKLWLEPKQKAKITLQKPTAESAKYRLYVRGQ